MLFPVRSQGHQDCSQACIYEDQCLEIQLCVLLTETVSVQYLLYQQTLKSNINTCELVDFVKPAHTGGMMWKQLVCVL